MWKMPLIVIALIMVSFSGSASEKEASETPLINVDMTLDLDGMERFAQDASHRQEP